MYLEELEGEAQKSFDGQTQNAAGRLERLEQRVQELQKESAEQRFSEYLCQMKSRVITQQYQIDLLADELERSYRMYQENMRQAQRETAPAAACQAEPVPAPAPRRKRDTEFTIGAAVLSVVGSIFILIALALLGTYFMNGFVKGLSLYAVCLAVMAIAELWVYRRWPGLGMTLSAIGMGGLYISTLVNYMALKNFGMWVAIGVTLAVTLGVIALSRKKDAAVYRILGMAAAYICILVSPMGRTLSDNLLTQGEFLVVTGILFMINLMCLLVPVRKAHAVINVVHMALNAVFTLTACFLWEEWTWDSVAQMWHYPAFVAVSLLVMQLIFISQVRWQRREKPDGPLSDNAGICITYGVSALLYALMVSMVTDFAHMLLMPNGMVKDEFLVQRLACSIVALLLCAIPIFVLRGRQERWFAWYLMNLLVLVIHFNSVETAETVYCLAALLAASELLSFTKNPMLRFSDAVLTTVSCIVLWSDYSAAYVIPLFVVLTLGVFCINYWKTYFATILTFSIAFYLSQNMLPLLKLPVFAGIMFVGLLIFNNVDRWRGDAIRVYNILVLAGQAVSFLMLVNPVYQNAYFTYLCMLIFGVSTIVICFQKKYQMDFALKQMALAIFLTYMALIVRTNYPIVNSILMMLIALVSVGMGFGGQKRAVRIYGLVLALAVCGKLVLYDFTEAPLLQRTLLFFSVGVLALVISAIYMILEKKEIQNQKRTEDETAQILEKQEVV